MRISDWSSDVCSSDLRALQEEESGLVVNLATALLLAGDKAALEDLDRRYGTAMAGSPRAETFALLAGEGAGTAVSSIADKLGDRKSVVSGQSVSVRVDLGGRRSLKKKKKNYNT